MTPKKTRVVVSLGMVFLAMQFHALAVGSLIEEKPYPLPVLFSIATVICLGRGLSEVEVK